MLELLHKAVSVEFPASIVADLMGFCSVARLLILSVAVLAAAAEAKPKAVQMEAFLESACPVVGELVLR